MFLYVSSDQLTFPSHMPSTRKSLIVVFRSGLPIQAVGVDVGCIEMLSKIWDCLVSVATGYAYNAQCFTVAVFVCVCVCAFHSTLVLAR